MKKIFFIGLFLVSVAANLSATEVRIVDGKAYFPKCVMGSQYFWKQQEADAYQIAFPTTTVMSVTPSNMEIAVSTSIAKFKNKSEFERCVNDTTYYHKVLNENRE